MGQIFSCCKPKKIQYTKVNGHVVTTGNFDAQEKEECDPRIYRNDVLTNLDEIIKSSKDEPDFCSRTFDGVYNLNYETIAKDVEVFASNFVFVEEVITEAELESYLNSCSTSPLSQTYDVDMDSPDANMMCETEQMLVNNEHIQLCQSTDDVIKLKDLLRSASQKRLLTDYIDNVDANGNTAVSVSLLSSNDEALLTLVMRFYADIPLRINVDGFQYLFLLYLIIHHNLRTNESNPQKFFLHIFLTEIKRRNDESADNAIVKKYLKAIDPTLKLSLLHFLVEFYLMGQARILQIYKCINICIKLLPEALQIMCQINNATSFSLDVISRIIICTNLTNISYAVQLIKDIQGIYPQIIIDGRTLYIQIIKAHNSMEIQNQLLPLFL